MKKPAALFVAFCLAATPLYARPPAGSEPPPPVHFASRGAPSLLEAAETAASSGAYRAQNTATITTGRIGKDDRKRSAMAFAISGVLAFAGAGLWRWLPCRNTSAGEAQEVGGVPLMGYNKCYTPDGERRGFDTPTNALLAAGVGLEVVSLLYLISHLRQDSGGAGSTP